MNLIKNKQLFFDDSKLFGRENVVRKYGKPEIAAIYSDGVCSTDFNTGNVFRLDNGKYRMLYFAHSKEFDGKKLFCAESSDGINFAPEKLCLHGKKYEHEIMDLPQGSEVGTIYEDNTCEKSEKYKMLLARCADPLSVNDEVYTSPDLINWTIKKDVSWGDGTEPLVSVFYNDVYKCHTVIERPFWGIRTVGFKETADWQSFTDYRYCLRADSEDEPLSEIYGMYSFAYDGMYIGIPHIYRNLKSELNAKYKNGIIDTQLAYSYDGRYWQRSLRKPFISGFPDDGCGVQRPLVWVASALKKGDEVLLYAATSKKEHGPAFCDPEDSGEMLVYRLRTDGFIYLETQNKNEKSVVSTREKAWHGGELSINIEAKNATVAVYDSCENEDVEGMNVLGIAKKIAGFTHDDCIPFSGDSTEWVPQFKNGRKIDELSGKTLVFEICFTDGKIYSISGNCTDLFNTEGARYRKFGILPKSK